MYTRKRVAQAFKHMSLDEGLILDRFQQITTLKGKWSYDVRLDVELIERQSWESLTGHKAWTILKQKRIDALLETEDTHYIIEVKTETNFAQLGQLLVYKTMYLQQYIPIKRVYLIALAAKVDKEIAAVMKQHSIRVIIC